VFYNEGRYRSLAGLDDAYRETTIDRYAMLYYLPELTRVTAEDSKVCVMLYNLLPHDSALFEAPQYAPVRAVTDRGSGPFADAGTYHVNIASFMLLARWFEFLQARGVYDNTRIIIVSDHGGETAPVFPGRLALPNGEYLESYNALLMVKDFKERGALRVDNTFMTNADVPYLAARGVVPPPANPFTGKPLAGDKTGGALITSSHKHFLSQQRASAYAINPGEWLRVHDDIFKAENWSLVTADD